MNPRKCRIGACRYESSEVHDRAARVCSHVPEARARMQPIAPKPRRKQLVRSISLLTALAMFGCASGIERVEEACAHHRASAAAYAGCLRSNYAILNSGPAGEQHISGIYLAAAEYQAAAVASGQRTDAEAMLELAAFNASVLAPAIQKQRDAAIRSAMQALQQPDGRGGQGRGGSGSSGGQGFTQRGAGYQARSSGYYR
jgi:hypothetical protein